MNSPTRLLLTCLLTCLCLLAGCQSEDKHSYEGPAVLVNPDANVTAQVHDAVSRALGGRHVMLAPDALTNSDRLTIEPAIHRTLQGRLSSGRSKGRPATFHLILRHSHCVLVHNGSDFSAEINGASCRPFKPRH